MLPVYPIETFVINLKEREDRLKNIKEQFKGKEEFSLNIVEAEKNTIGAVGLWNTASRIVRIAKDRRLPYVLICEDDHIFTTDYSKDFFFNTINQAASREAGILLGGISSVGTAIEIRSTDLFWVSFFSGSQFIVVFETAYDCILSVSFREEDHIDALLCRILINKFVVFPFISVQKEFGYSDITRYYELNPGYVDRLFAYCADELSHLRRVGNFYNAIQREIQFEEEYIDDICRNTVIPTYIICPETVDTKIIKRKFNTRPEFDTHCIRIERSFWHTVQQVIKVAKENKEDAIVICNDTHSFSRDYNTRIFFTTILEGQELDIDILIGGMDSLHNAVPVTGNGYWVTGVIGAQFLVIYSNCFDKVLLLSGAEYEQAMASNDQLCAITTNKMVIYPFVADHTECWSLQHLIPGNKSVIADKRSADEKLSIYGKYILETI